MNKCIACESLSFDPTSVPQVVQCTRCGLGQLLGVNFNERLVLLRKENRIEQSGARAPENADKEHKARAMRSILKGYNAWLGYGDIVQETATIGHCFEVGFGNGHMMEEAIKLDWLAEGCEASQQAYESASNRDLDVFKVKFDSLTLAEGFLKGKILEFPPNYYDLVWAWDSFEHMENLGQAFKNAWYLLKSKGIFVMSSPNLSLYRDNMDHPHGADLSHLWHMTFDSAKLLAERAGFEVLRIITGTGIVWLDEQYAHPENFVLWGRKP